MKKIWPKKHFFYKIGKKNHILKSKKIKNISKNSLNVLVEVVIVFLVSRRRGKVEEIEIVSVEVK